MFQVRRFTVLSQPPLFEPKNSGSPWKSHGQRIHSARHLSPLTTQMKKGNSFIYYWHKEVLEFRSCSLRGWGLPASIQRGSYGALVGVNSISLSTGSVVAIMGTGECLSCEDRRTIWDGLKDCLSYCMIIFRPQNVRNSLIQQNLWHVREPLQDSKDTLKVIWHTGVCNSIIVHDLNSAKLVVGSIHLSAQNLERNRNWHFFFFFLGTDGQTAHHAWAHWSLSWMSERLIRLTNLV